MSGFPWPWPCKSLLLSRWLEEPVGGCVPGSQHLLLPCSCPSSSWRPYGPR